MMEITIKYVQGIYYKYLLIFCPLTITPLFKYFLLFDARNIFGKF